MSLSWRYLCAWVALSCVLVARRADAIMQPNGTVIPVITSMIGACTSGSNVQACLNDNEVLLGGMAGTIGAVQNATIDQETFDPKCQLTFKVLSKGGSVYGHAFGWYPARPGDNPPPLSDLHVFLNCMDCVTPGTTKTLTIPANVGAIGFFTASYIGGCTAPNEGTLTMEPSYTMYSERRFNGRLRNGMPDPMSVANYIRVLTWQSIAEPSSFYFGWEDNGSASSDNNFNDLVTWVSGIECSSGGQPCDTGMKGICAKGTRQCRAGALTCVGDQMPVPEKCNAVDDNCDGNVDEGNPCIAGFVCFRGSCVPNCARGEFTCNGATVCETDAGVCVDAACRDINCPAEQVCRAGKCIGECDGVKCPYGQSCQHGGCVDVCASLQCDTGFVCTPSFPSGADKEPVGVCSNCGCQGCTAGTTCSNKHCVPNDCAMVNCLPGTHCQAGQCVDNCAGAMCPVGQKCNAGQCVSDGSGAADGGRESGPPVVIIVGTTGPGTTTGGGTSGMVPPGSGTGTAGAGNGSSGGAGPGGDGTPGGDKASASCGCRIPGRGSPREAALAALALVGGAIARRRARRAQDRSTRVASPNSCCK